MKIIWKKIINYAIPILLFGFCQTGFGFGIELSDEKIKQCKKDRECYCWAYADTYQLAADMKAGGAPPEYALALVGDYKKVITEKVAKKIINQVYFEGVFISDPKMTVFSIIKNRCTGATKSFKPLK